jgi:hypothetical protein
MTAGAVGRSVIRRGATYRAARRRCSSWARSIARVSCSPGNSASTSATTIWTSCSPCPRSYVEHAGRADRRLLAGRLADVSAHDELRLFVLDRAQEGVKKHVRVLEDADLVITEKMGGLASAGSGPRTRRNRSRNTGGPGTSGSTD